ncbi:MAG TPA: MCE family protein [Acidimicrobiales bacterium]|nr:MCE family protein [Acidimicrobiales bacterium]
MSPARRHLPRLLAVLLAASLALSGCGLVGGGDTYEVVAYFPRAVSLYESGAVQVLGLPAGEVSDIEIQGDRVKVTLAVDSDIPLPADVRAAIAPQSLIGERRIQLFPPFQQGDQQAQDGHEIAIEDTVIPVEPDEALASLKEFLDALDPNGAGRLIDNAAASLDGQGQQLGSALDELSDLVGNIEDNDDAIISIAERFDDFTSTLLTRESQLAQVLDDFAVVADVLAEERGEIESLISGLANLSGDGLDLVSEHAVRLRTDVQILQRLTESIEQNLGGVDALIEGGSQQIDGFIDAYNPVSRSLNLRNNFSPLVEEALAPIFESVGIPFPCLPVDVNCASGDLLPLDGERDGAVEADLPAPTTPIDDVLDLLGSPTVAPVAARGADEARTGERSMLDRFLGTFLGVGS